MVRGLGKGSRPEAEVAGLLKKRGLTVAAAESCTGGLLSASLTSVPGSSGYFTGSVVAYDNEVKKKLLGVKADTLAEHGAVSEKTAREMAVGVRQKLSTDVGVSITGIAGPTGGTEEKPVGTVFIGVSVKRGKVEGLTSVVEEFHFTGTRDEVRSKAAACALGALESVLRS